VDRDRIGSPRHDHTSRFHQSCRTLGKWFSELRSASYQYSPRAYQRTESSMMTYPLTGNGHRRGQRIAVDIPVQVVVHDSPAIHGHLKNLSLSGALMEPTMSCAYTRILKSELSSRKQGAAL
jgi:hypothetical protein